jgi:hypothetical protein
LQCAPRRVRLRLCPCRHFACGRRGLDRSFDFFLARRVDRHDRLIVAVRQRDQSHAFRQFDVRQVEDLVQLERSDVDLEVFGQVARQAADFDVREQVVHDTALFLDALRARLVEEVDGHVQRDLHVLANAQEVHVHDHGPRRMALDRLDDDLLGLRADLERQNARVERFAAHLVAKRVVIEDQRLGGIATAIHDGGHFAGLAQAACVSAAELRAWLSGQFECGFHGLVPPGSRAS